MQVRTKLTFPEGPNHKFKRIKASVKGDAAPSGLTPKPWFAIHASKWYERIDFHDTTQELLHLQVVGGKCNHLLGQSMVQVSYQGCKWKRPVNMGKQNSFVTQVPAHPLKVKLMQVTALNGNIYHDVTANLQVIGQREQRINLTQVEEAVRPRGTVLVPKYDKCKASSVKGNGKVGKGKYGQGRLGSNFSWTAAKNKTGEWWQFDLGEKREVCGIETRANGNDKGQRVTKYSVDVSEDGEDWEEIDDGADFNGNLGPNSVHESRFKKSELGRYVRIYPQRWIGGVSMRAGVVACDERAEDPPTRKPTRKPTGRPTTKRPTNYPTRKPTRKLTKPTSKPAKKKVNDQPKSRSQRRRKNPLPN
jgi:hypothetical protein